MAMRDNTFDIMKCIGIIAVIIGHLTTIGHSFVFSFHMLLFFIVSGYFYHRSGVLIMMAKDAKHLLVPYLYTCISCALFYLLLSILKRQDLISNWVIAAVYANGTVYHTSAYLSHVPVIGAIWFLWALFWCKEIFNLVQNCELHKYLTPPHTHIFLLLAMAAVVIDRCLVNMPFALLPGISAIPFYAIGYSIHKNGGFEKINKWIAIACVALWGLSFSFFNMSMSYCYADNYVVNFLGACGGTYVVWHVSKMISRFSGLLVGFLVWIGRNSLIILCIHAFELNVPIHVLLHIPSSLTIPFVLGFCISGTFILSKFSFVSFKMLVGSRNIIRSNQ